MSSFWLLLALGNVTLPGYALGQPLSDAQLVVPAQSSREKWFLRCAGDTEAPDDLQISAAEKQAGVSRCWTMERIDNHEVRAAYPLRGAERATQEIELLRGRIVRITVVRYHSTDDQHGTKTVRKKPNEAALIDSL